MKKIYITFFCIATMGFLASCSDFLDVAPKDKVLEEDQFKTEAGINGALNGLYRQMISTNLYGGNLSQTTLEVMGHYYTYANTEPLTSYLEVPIYLLANGSYTGNSKVEGIFTDIWKSGYNTILNINYFLKSVEESPAIIKRENKETIMGEAYGLRAYLHFDLFRLFGPRYEDRSDSKKVLPYNNSTDIVLNHTGYEDHVYSTAEDYMGYVLDDIRKAEALLKADPVLTADPTADPSVIDDDLISDNYMNRNRRMNYYAVKALEARVLQYMGDNVNAAIAAKVVTDQVGTGKLFRWSDATTIVSKSDYSFFHEVVFGINNPDMTSNYNAFFAKTSLRDIYAVDRNNLIKNIYAGFGENQKEIVDVRSKQWIESNTESNTSYSRDGTFISRKFNIISNNEIPALVNFQPLVRITEMYYIQAEAALVAGDKPTAVRLLNMIAGTRGIPETNLYNLSETDDEETFNNHIESEYYKEFYGEGQIFFYHKRKNNESMFVGNGEDGKKQIDRNKIYNIPIPTAETNI